MTTIFLNLDGLLNANDRKRLLRRYRRPRVADNGELAKLHIESDNHKERADCTVKALAAVADIPYVEAHRLLAGAGRRHGHGFKLFGWLERQYHIFGVDPVFGKYKATPVRMYEEPTLAKVLRDFPRGRFLCRQRNHAFAIIDGKPFNANGSYMGSGGSRIRVKKMWYFEQEKTA